MKISFDDVMAEFPDAKKIGEGAQKAVFRVIHKELGKCVLKVGAFESQNALKRIKREFKVLKEINSKFYPQCHKLKIIDEKRFYILEQELEGSTLTEKLSDYFTVTKANNLITTLVNALKVLWDKNVVHRDVKPDNIFIGKNGEVWIIDLGIARLLDDTSLTHDLQPHGPCTPIYASPEQLCNRKYEINHRSDQFSLGIIYSQLLLDGLHPFDPNVVESGESIVKNILNNNCAIEKLRSICEKSTLVINRMISHEPHQRFKSTEELIDNLGLIK